jgi:hypothetical protein
MKRELATMAADIKETKLNTELLLQSPERINRFEREVEFT